jgi:membrane protease YdiL (CAAX protease family)
MTGGAERISCSVWRWPPLPYTRFSRSVFLLVHATPVGATLQFFGDFASGVLGGILAWRSGSLAIPIAIHWRGEWNPWAGTALSVGSR